MHYVQIKIFYMHRDSWLKLFVDLYSKSTEGIDRIDFELKQFIEYI